MVVVEFPGGSCLLRIVGKVCRRASLKGRRLEEAMAQGFVESSKARYDPGLRRKFEGEVEWNGCVQCSD
jgi:hypothetical protein